MFNTEEFLKPIIGYARVSSDDQANSSYSLQNQRKRLKGFGCENILSDVESAYKGNDRQGFSELISMVKTGRVKTIVVSNLDRFSRNEAEAFTTFNLLEKYDVRLLSLDQPWIDIRNPDGRAIAGYAMVDARAYSARLSRRVRQGHQAHRDRNAAYFAPFGYIKTKEKFELDHSFCIELNGENLTKAQVARDMVKIFLDCQSLRKSLRIINEKYNIKTPVIRGKGNRQPRGHLGFSAAGFSSWLNNPILRGHIAFGRTRKQRQSHKNFWDLRRDTHPEHKIISDKEYIEIIDRVLNHNAATGGYGFKGEIKPLSGLVRCGVCDCRCRVTHFKLRTDPSIKKFSYQCSNYHLKRCDHKPSTRYEIIEEAVVSALIHKAEELANIAVSAVEENSEAMEPPEISQMRSQLAQLESIPGAYDNSALVIAMEQVKRQIEVALLAMRSHDKTSAEIEDLIYEFKKLDYWECLTPIKKRSVLRALVDSIIIKDRRVISINLKL